MTDRTDVERSIAAWDQTIGAMITLGASFTHDEWSSSTECPGWTVKDIYSHLIGGEVWMSHGHPQLPQGLAGIADEPVAARAATSGEQVLAELREVFTLRRDQLQNSPPDPEQPTETAYRQPVTVGVLLRLRAFDAWVHEQDVRRAVARPGNLATPAAQLSREVYLLSLPRVIARVVGAPPGSSVRFIVAGDVAFDIVVSIDDERRGHLAPTTGNAATVSLAMSWEMFARLGAGRIAPSEAAVEVTGERDLGDRVLAHLAITP
jgi:uncharacterized protein (TIGR03083 family)